MEVPAKFRSAMVGFRYWLVALLFLAASTLLVSCNNGGSTLIIISPNIGSIVLTIDEEFIVAGGVATTTVTAEVFDFDGNPVLDGTTVNFTITPMGTITASATTTSGIAVALITSDTTSGQYHVSATSGDAGAVAFGEFVPGSADEANTSLTANPTSIPADGTSISVITLVAKDANGNPVADDTIVNFYTTEGTLSADTATAANGIATVELTSTDGDNVVANVTAVVSGIAKTTVVGMGAIVGRGSGTASYIELSISEFSIRVKDAGGGENSVITAVARDESGNPINDFADNIRFSIENGPGGGVELDGSLVPATKTTENGTASVSLTSGTVSGTVTIRVEVILDGEGSDVGAPFATALTTGIAIEAGEVANISIFQDNLVEPNDDGSISQSFSALVQDKHGNPVENGTVVFFGLVDNPDPNGPPYLGYKSSGTNGVTSGSMAFSSSGNSFVNDGLRDDDILIILEGQDEGGHRIQTVNNSTSLTLYNILNGSQSGLDFVAGSSELGTVCGSVQTGNLEMASSCIATTIGDPGSIKGVAHTKLTWIPQAIFKPFHLYAESVGGDVGDTLADFYPGVAPGSVLVSIVPDAVLAGTAGIFVQAEIEDGAENPIQGQPVSFSSSNPGIAFISGSNPVITGPNGQAATEIDTVTCTEGGDVEITAALGSLTGTASLSVAGTLPTADFTCIDAGNDNDANCSDNSTTIVGTTIVGWSWDVACNDTEDSSQANPTLALGAGTTNVCLTVTNDLGCTMDTKKPVTIAAGGPAASFLYTENNNGTANFNNTSTAAPGTTNTTWAWSFPAGTIPAASSSSNPTNVDFGAVGGGPHSVTLTVTNNFGVSDAVTNSAVSVSAGAPTAVIGSVDNGNCTVTLSDASTSPDSSVNNQWSWTFTGGTPATSSVQNPGVVDYTGTLGGGGVTTAPLILTVTNNFGNSDSTGATTVPITCP